MEIDGCLLPEDRLYDLETDVWLRPSEDGRSVRVGLASWLAAFAGKFQRITYRPLEGTVARGRSVATLESIRYTGALRLPATGEVTARNPALAARPKLLNDHPYDEGWVVEVVLEDPAEPARFMEPASQIGARLAEKIRRMRIRCFPAVPDVELYEVGAECQAILVRLDEEIQRLGPEDIVLLVTDDPTAPIEMVRWEDRSGHKVLHHRREGNLHQFLIRRESHPVPHRRPA